MTDSPNVVTETNVPKTQEIDAAKIAEDAAKIAEERATAKLEEQTAEIAEKAQVSARQAIVDQLSDKKTDRWVPKDYEEVVERAKTESREEREEETKKLEEVAKAKEEQTVKEKEEAVKKWNKHWDTQLDGLVKDGKIATIDEQIQKKLDAKEDLTDEDKKDAGLQAREQIFEKARELKEPNLELVYYKHLSGEKKQAGRPDAPVAGARRGITPADKTGYSYEEIRDSSFEEIMQGK